MSLGASVVKKSFSAIIKDIHCQAADPSPLSLAHYKQDIKFLKSE